MESKLNIANGVTLSRIVFAALVLFCNAFSARFYAFYLLGGFTDMIDGWLARKLNLRSSFGAKLDTIADYAFAVAVLIKVLPALHTPIWLRIWIVAIAFIKIANLAASLALFRRIVPIHTVMNKVTGFMLFLAPLCIGAMHSWLALAIVACSAATFAAILEGRSIRTGKDIE